MRALPFTAGLARKNAERQAIFMSGADVAEILELPPEERMRIAEIIWASPAAALDTVPLGDAHRALIGEAIAEHERNPGDAVSREHVLAEASRRR